jgi:hypothetical protein
LNGHILRHILERESQFVSLLAARMTLGAIAQKHLMQRIGSGIILRLQNERGEAEEGKKKPRNEKQDK